MPRLGALGNVYPVPGHYTSDPKAEALVARGKSAVEKSLSLAAWEALGRNEDPESSEEYQLLERIATYKSLQESEMSRLRAVFDRFDNLYHPTTFTTGGADHWPEHALDPKNRGKVHVSVNVHRAYVDIPAALQSIPPYENIPAKENNQEARDAAARAERLYFQWLEDDDREEKDQLAAQTKALYGYTFGKVYWDQERRMPTLQIIENPSNLYVGWGSNDFERIDWTVYCYRISPQAIEEDYGLKVAAVRDGEEDGQRFPFVYDGDHLDPLGTVHSGTDRGTRYDGGYERLFAEVYDFWYKKPGSKPGATPEVWNAIFVGNKMVKNQRHREYLRIPYIPLRNAKVPGTPYGPSELHDIEQLLREKDERITDQAQMIRSIVGGQRYQIVGPDAPDEVPPNAMPGPNGVAAPGPGNEIKAITPFVPEFAIEDYNKRIDRELEVVSGLNEVLLGTVPTSALNSSKALQALVANYEARIAPKRALFYRWRREVWEMAARVWEAKDRDVKLIIDGHYRLEVKPADIAYRDDLETASKVISLAQNRVISLRTAADMIGIEDPEGELDIIREEQTDASLNPGAVLTQVQLAGAIQQQQAQANPQNQEALSAAGRQGANARRTQNQPARGSPSANAPETQGQGPQEPGNPNAPNPQEAGLLSQTLVDTSGESQGRLLSQQKL